jgi:membrane-bound inhibitor of C-type lysozyme
MPSFAARLKPIVRKPEPGDERGRKATAKPTMLTWPPASRPPPLELTVRRLVLALTVVGLTLSACATQPGPAITTPVTYGCAKAKSFQATYPANGKKAIVSAGGVTRALPLARSASGARYAKGAFEIWGKGDSARLSGFPGGPYDNCQAR